MKIIISAGGTGGHIYPAIAIINKLKEMEKNVDILYIGTTDRMEKDIIPNLGINYVGIEMSGLSKNIVRCFNTFIKLIKSNIKCKKIIKEFKPDVVIGVGGYVTVPVIYNASKLKIPTILHEQNSVPGKANKFLSKYATTICVSMEDSIKYFEKEKCVFTGNPRSEEVLKGIKANKNDYNLSLTKKLVLITTGSLGASTINEKIVNMLPKFENKNYEVLLVSGKENYDDIKNNRFPKNVKVVPYIEDMPSVLKVTDLIITRAGATIIAEFTSLGIPSILIPSPYVANNHQYLNAKALSDKNASYLVEEKDFNEDKLISLIDKILDDKEEYKKLKENTLKLGVKNSQTKIYNEIKKLESRKK